MIKEISSFDFLLYQVRSKFTRSLKRRNSVPISNSVAVEAFKEELGMFAFEIVPNGCPFSVSLLKL
ncbi:hypothetical protein D3C72_2519270 [compost metagenome]